MPFLAGEDGSELLDAMYDLGVNAFDIARGYGVDTQRRGAWRYNRQVQSGGMS